MIAGDVFRLTKGADKHAKIIISDPVNFPDKVLFVGMTSWDALEDQSCILTVGEHSTVTHRTCITYSRGNAKASNAEIDKMLAAGLLRKFEPATEEVLKRIRQGAILSTRTPGDFKKMLIEQGLVDDAGERDVEGYHF
jgi:hypothetical protein